MRAQLDGGGAGPCAAPNKSPTAGANAWQELCWVCTSPSPYTSLQTYWRSHELLLRAI